ncbi:DegQ family serine endoprotease [Oleiagrimonas sp. C23AA]|uniref:DegQ family serine endoprotease n=1 Tax=Oleiagrimonas sp. C23AA TaxID=2719047 RepID=UPI001422B9AA|nr:DegQ family serine endoprotease [Oleiagrimonas sp. C23AA]NII09669.1 DegQ family serine endoprotease [Oleiagrimonas sp. C23AA]
MHARMRTARTAAEGRLFTWLSALFLVLGATGVAQATIPAAVNGQAVPSLAPMLKGVTPAVVNIASKSHVRSRDPYFSDPVLRQFFGGRQAPEQTEQSLGSGVIVNAQKGYVLTNNHVIAGADDITVTLKDGRAFKAKLVGTDPDTDIAVVQIPAQHLTALPLADSKKLQVGDFVVAVGDPFGLGQTVTSGIVSAKGRTGLGHTYQNFIQTDASINPGNSGGALVNLKGELVGINSMIYSPSGASAGIGFAIPSDLAQEIMQQLLKYGKVRRGTLGLDTQALTPRMAKALNVSAGKGVVVTQVEQGSPAARAGVEPGDVITQLNGRPMDDPHDLRNAEGLLPVGSQATLTVLRNGHSHTLSTRIEPEHLATLQGQQLDPRLAGVNLRDLPKALRSQGVAGVEVHAIDARSDAAQQGLDQGDVILAVNQRRVTAVADLKRLFSRGHPRQLMLTILRDQQMYYLMLH